MFGKSRKLQQRKDLDYLYLKCAITIDEDFPIDETVILNMIHIAIKENYGAYGHAQDLEIYGFENGIAHLGTSYEYF